ncbi:hypothetical protein H113_07987 [Trichophyton rubrum MR1459]|nr:hypothetical protein H113_07987 [Trichophyton rubrum MR1459]
MNYKPKGNPTLGMAFGDAYTQEGRPSTLHSTSSPYIPTVTSCYRPDPPGLNGATFELAGDSKHYTIEEIVKDSALDRAVIEWNGGYETFMQVQRWIFADS